MSNDANQKPKLTQNKFLQALKGREILVVFLDGKAAQGVLKAYDQYTLFLQRDDGLEVAVFKHAVKYVHAVRKK
jgi:sRNA-binding regulator protein Hfq